jgi:hypothetical protein
MVDEEARQVFTSVAQEVEGMLMQNSDTALDGLLNRWKDPVLAACKRLTENDVTPNSGTASQMSGNPALAGLRSLGTRINEND